MRRRFGMKSGASNAGRARPWIAPRARVAGVASAADMSGGRCIRRKLAWAPLSRFGLMFVTPARGASKGGRLWTSTKRPGLVYGTLVRSTQYPVSSTNCHIALCRILHPPSSILHPLSSILYPPSPSSTRSGHATRTGGTNSLRAILGGIIAAILAVSQP